MKKIISLLLFISIGFAQDKPLSTTVIQGKELYVREVAGVGFAFQGSSYKSFFIKVMSKVTSIQYVKSGSKSTPIHQTVLVAPSAIRLGYATYPLEIKELGENFIEADVYKPRTTKLGTIVKSKKIGHISLTFTQLDGVYGGKGSLTMYNASGNTTYTIYYFEPDASNKAFYLWAPEMKQ